MGSRNIPSRQLIAEYPGKRPYASKLCIALDESIRYQIGGEACLLVGNDLRICIAPSTRHPEIRPPAQVWDISLEGFATACEAEQSGLKFAMSVLWSAIKGGHPIRLLYHTPLPCVVYDRTRSGGLSFSGFATLTLGRSVQTIVQLVEEVFSSPVEIDRRLVLSMELFAAARMETTERARFIGLVSSIEPLADQQLYDKSILDLVNSFKHQVRQDDSIAMVTKDSLINRVGLLASESISQGIRRLVRTHLPDDEPSLETITEAYNIRSRILHDGSTEADLNEKSNEFEAVMRKLFASMLKVPLTLDG